jgi:hypothetical protein
MKLTWSIITSGNYPHMIDEIISKINLLNMPDYEIIVCGGEDVHDSRHIPFEEDGQGGWITRKKNETTKASKGDAIAYLHDYLKPCSDFWEGFKEFGWDWDICMTRILNADGSRFRDWCLSPEVELPAHRDRERLLPYSYIPDPKKMYISGAFWVAKREFMMEHMLDESLRWGQGEDVEWSNRSLSDGKYVMNGHSTVSLMKMKNVSFVPMQNDLIGVVA